MRRALLAAVALAVLALPAGAAAELPRLHAERGAAAGIYTADGRQVILRGVNDNQLGDYYQADPQLATTAPLTQQDFADMAADGFDVVRLVLSWSRLEPQRGVFDESYLARIRQAVAWAGAAGIHVVLDMHQDAWGKFVATPPGESCPPPLAASIGWDGAPAWATFTDGLPTCHLQQREIAPAVAEAWQSFYLDRDGIQGELVKTWARLARAFAADPAVAGYDLLNEPNPGFALGVSDATLLGVYYARALRAIRAAEAGAPGGFHHIAFFEPGVIWSAAGFDLVPLPPFVDDPDTVFAPHLYAGSITLDRALGLSLVSVQSGFGAAALAARVYGTTVWSGEWGWFGDPRTDDAQIAAYAQQEDAHLWGGAWWQWKQACGDPHSITSGGPVHTSPPGTTCPPPPELGAVDPTGRKLRILTRAYPRAAPGRLTSLSSDPDSGAFAIRGADAGPAAGSCELDVWIPRADRPVLEARNLTGLTLTPVPGGWRATACAGAGAYELSRR